MRRGTDGNTRRNSRIQDKENKYNHVFPSRKVGGRPTLRKAQGRMGLNYESDRVNEDEEENDGLRPAAKSTLY